MNNGNKIQWILGMAAGTAMLVMATGCQPEKTEPVVHGEVFVTEENERAVNAFVANEAANEARIDATLRSYHFDGPILNSLGEERLELMLRNAEIPSPLIIYLDLPEDDARTAKRHDVVVAFLKDHGLNDDQIKVKNGPNPESNSPVAPLLAGQAASGGAGAAAAVGGGGTTAH